MTTIGNFIWFIFGGGFLAFFWLILSGLCYITIIGAPVGRACLEFAKLSAFPFGKEIIRETDVIDENNIPKWRKILTIVLNTLWFCIGITLTLVYFIYAIISCLTIIGIPVGIVYMRMGKFILFPIGARVVTKKEAYARAVVNEMNRAKKVGNL